MSSLLRATSPVSFPHSSPLVLLISHVKEDRIKSPSSINTSQPCISDQCLPVCRTIHYYTLYYGLIILAMVYSMAPSGPFNVACTIQGRIQEYEKGSSFTRGHFATPTFT